MRNAGTHRERTQNPKRIHALEVRRIVERSVEEYFESEGLVKVRTPLMVCSPGMEPHIRPFELKSGSYLPTSPEFAMKQLLAGGLPNIYQICPAFRLEPPSRTHSQEFTMLEWYRTGAHLEDLMRDVEQIFHRTAQKIFENDWLTFQGHAIDLRPPWPRRTVASLFEEHMGLDLAQAIHDRQLPSVGMTSDQDSWDDRFFRLWLNEIEPRLPVDRPVFVTDYPPSLAALARVENDSRGNPWAKRFEVFAGGLELGNAFWELTDPVVQRARHAEFMAVRKAAYGESFPPTPLDPDFISALDQGLPESAGMAVGLDRVIMLFADEPDISYTFWI